MANRLASESSPYLRQHAHNPVDWYPWGPEALGRSEREDRPILLSVGYSSCHWCHVMERESFEDPAIAALMNEHFVSIKVDREERPDIDQIYMRAVQALTGRGGWPMTVFLTPARVPFFGGTYFPPEPRPGMPSFPQVLSAVHDAWTNRRDQVLEGSTRLLEALAGATTAGSGGGGADPGLLDGAVRALEGQYDARWGGFGPAPKFPQPTTLEILFRHHARTGDPASLEMAVHTLRRMAAGGMRDHLAGGFHRYSVDARWLVPHFEKMLYDNALLASAYLDGWRLTGASDLADVATSTLDYVLADLRDPGGGFYSARDADSEGEEGRFYVWSLDEVEGILGPEDASLFARTYDVTAQGNFEGRRNILHLPHDPTAIAAAEGLADEDLRARLDRSRALLLERRSTRVAPFRDEKVLVSWNGLTIRALAEAGAALGRPDYVEAAVRAADFAWHRMRSDDRLLHSWIQGEASIPAFLDDHAALGNALLTLHGVTLESRWLDAALQLCEEIAERFWDESAGTVFDSPSDAEALIVRPRDPTDGATPSGASLAAELFARAGHLASEDRHLAMARRIVDREADSLARFPSAFGRMLSVVDRLHADPLEIVIVGGDDDATRSLVRAAYADFLPGAVVTGVLEGGTSPALPVIEGRTKVEGRAAAYVCRAYACRLPVTTPEALTAEVGPSAPS